MFNVINFSDNSSEYSESFNLDTKNLKISGLISTDTTWNVTESPYYITDNLLVEQGVKLTIKPGVKVLFNGSYSIVVDGALNATGTNEEPILFSSNATNPQKTDWGSLYFRDTSLDSQSIVKFCNISYSTNGILLESAYPIIENNIIHNNSNGLTVDENGIVDEGSIILNNNSIFMNTNGISFIDSDHDFIIITENSIYNNTNNGINIDGYITSHYFLIQNNIISNNTNNGIYISGVKAGNDIFIKGNKIKNNLNGINLNDFTWGSTVEIENNSIESNNNDGIYINDLSDQDEYTQHLISFNDIINNTNYCLECRWNIYTEIIKATNNWWGTNNSNIIETLIYDYYDDFNLAKVLYVPFLSHFKDDDLKVPIISVISPSMNDVFGFDAPNFNISISDKSPINTKWYTLDGGLTNYSFPGLTGYINQTVWDGKDNGILTLRFYANDSFGYLGFKDILIEKDTIAPIISINSPTPNQLCGVVAPAFDIQIIEQNLLEKWYSLNGGQNITFTVETQFNQIEWDKIGNGAVIITFYSNDKAGNINFSQIFVQKDNNQPQINIISPNTNDIFENIAPQFMVEIIDSNLDTMWYTIDEGLTNIEFTINGSIDSVLWNAILDGIVILKFYANDTAGNVNIESVNIIKDTVPPITIIISPNSNEVFGINAPTFEILIDEANLESSWYTIDDGLTNITFSGLIGSIDQDTWNNASQGEVLITFYSRDVADKIGMNSVIVVKTIPSETEIPGYNLTLLIGMFFIISAVLMKKQRQK